MAVLTDAKSFTFQPDQGALLDLSGALLAWNDKIGIRLALHRYLKRDGAEAEHMGDEPGRFTMRLCFLGPTWAAQYRALVAALRKSPKGQMVHPLLGTLRVACEGIPDAAVVPAEERDSINLTLSFVEDAVDATIIAAAFISPAQRQGNVSSLAAQVVTLLSQSAAYVSAAMTLAGDAITYAVAATASASSSTPDPTLDQKLATVGTDTNAAIAAARSAAAQLAQPTVVNPTPGAGSDEQAYAAMAICEALYSECLALAESIATSKPVVVNYTVPATTDIATLAARLYGKDALARMSEITTMNRIPNPRAIPSGTVLQLATPTI